MGIISFLCSLPEAVLPARSQPVFLRKALESIYKHTFRYRWKNRSFTVKAFGQYGWVALWTEEADLKKMTPPRCIYDEVMHKRCSMNRMLYL